MANINISKRIDLGGASIGAIMREAVAAIYNIDADDIDSAETIQKATITYKYTLVSTYNRPWIFGTSVLLQYHKEH